MRNTILIVDDDPQILKLCRNVLEKSDYVVTEASDGREALTAIRETAFDLIVLDLSLPEMDGFEFMSAIRVALPKPKIICISGFMAETMLLAAKRYGAAATLAKPFTPDLLISVVCKVLADGSGIASE